MFFEILFKKFNNCYEKIFFNYGLILSKYPIYFIVGSLIINIVLSLGILKSNMIEDIDNLFMVRNSKAIKNEKFLKELFNSVEMVPRQFFLHQIFDLGTGGEINFRVRGDSTANILVKDCLDEIRGIRNLILENVTAVYENETIKFKDICATRNENCWIEGTDLLNDEFLKFLNDTSIALRNNKTDLESFKDNIYFSSSGGINFIELVLGRHFKYIVNDNDPLIVNSNQKDAYARIFKLRFQLRYNLEANNLKVQLWESEFLKFVENIKTKHVSFTYSASISLEEEMKKNEMVDTFYVSATFMLIMMFATIFMSIKSNCITSPGLILPTAGILSAMFGFLSSYGFLSYVGYSACNLVMVVPFLIIGKFIILFV